MQIIHNKRSLLPSLLLYSLPHCRPLRLSRSPSLPLVSSHLPRPRLKLIIIYIYHSIIIYTAALGQYHFA